MKISQMPQSTTPSSDDVLAMLEGGTANKKVTFGTLAEWVAGENENTDLNTDDKTLVGALNEHEADIAQISADLDDIKSTGGVEETVSGSVIALNDSAAETTPVEMKLNIEPHQDLHGYDHPWVGGAGKNLLNANESYNVNAQRTLIFDITLPAGTYTFSLIATNGSTVIGYARLIKDNSTLSQILIETGATNKSYHVTFTLTEESTFNIQGAGASSGYSFTISNLMIESGSTATAYEPYENICPISGYTAVNVTRTGKNLLEIGDPRTISVDSATCVINQDKTVTVSGTFNAGRSIALKGEGGGNPIIRLKAGEYVASNCNVQINGVTSVGAMTSPKTFTANDGDYISYVWLYFAAGSKDTTVYKPQLELGSAVTDFEPGQGETYPITIPTEAGTVYGGTLDMKTGELVVDRASIDLGSSTWSQQTDSVGPYFRANKPQGMKLVVLNVLPNVISERYSIAPSSDVKNGDIAFSNGSGGYIFIRDESVGTLAEFTNIINGSTIVYELETPIAYTLTPTELELLKGSNTIWMDADGTIDLTYNADIKTYIDNKIAELQALVLENNG